MCTSIVEIVEAVGYGKGQGGWVRLSHAMVSYDHPHHAMLDDAIIVDFMNQQAGPVTRVTAELSLASAKALRGALDKAIAAAEEEEAERPAPATVDAVFGQDMRLAAAE